MKMRFALLFLLLSVTASGLKAQNVAVGIHGGFAALVNKSTAFGVPVGVNAEWAFDADHSFAALAHYQIGPRAGDPDFFYVSPEYKYHVSGETLNGFYIGAYVGFGGGGGSGYISLGGLTGYSVTVGKNFNLDAGVQLGYGNFANFRTHVFHALPTFAARYMF